MEAMTTLPWGRELTAHDLATMPDDGHRYELIDGTLVVTPAPSRQHQSASAELFLLLTRACPPHLLVRFAPVDVQYDERTVVQPDLLVVERAAYEDPEMPLRPVLAVEILSPSTRLIDLNLKKARYERAGCASYWVIDLDAPGLLAWELRDGAYAAVADVAAGETWTANLPFEVAITPVGLLG